MHVGFTFLLPAAQVVLEKTPLNVCGGGSNVHMVCGAGSVKRSGVRLSVHLIHRSHATAEGLLLWAGW